MTAQTKTIIKSYFETGDKPTQGNFGDLIDSYLDAGTVSAGTNGIIISVSGNISGINGITGRVLTSNGPSVAPSFQQVSYTSAAITSGIISNVTILTSNINACTVSSCTMNASVINTSTINSSTLNAPIIVNPTLNGITVSGATGTGGNIALSIAPVFTGTPQMPSLAVGSPGGQYGNIAVQAPGSTTFCMGLNNSDSGAGGQTTVNFLRNGSSVGSINTTNANTSYVTSSDKRLKTNAAPLKDANRIINSIQAVTYNWVDIEGCPEGVGFLAQDLIKIIPEAVTSGDSDNSLTDRMIEGFQIWGVDMAKIIPYLVAKSQDDSLLIKQLSERINLLEQSTGDKI